jgi:hypothetical protein
MPDWLQDSLNGGALLPWNALVWRLSLSLLFGLLVAGVYLLSHKKPRSETGPFVVTLVLLSILIAMVTIVIGSSVARAFSLVGALAIVRFRTVVADTRDTAFVIFAVVVGMGAGAGDAIVPITGIPLVGAAAWALSRWSRAGAGTVVMQEYTLTVRVGMGRELEQQLRDLIAQHAVGLRLQGGKTSRQGSAMDLTYHVRLRDGQAALVLLRELHLLEGVQQVELA